jgi:hypothetical protein
MPLYGRSMSSSGSLDGEIVLKTAESRRIAVRSGVEPVTNRREITP